MRVAVILTGALRTIKKTIHYFKQNVVLTSDVHVFICVQNDTTESNESWHTWFSEQLGEHLKTMQWFSLSNYPDWVSLRNQLVEVMPISDMWKHYLRTSGSMIEFFQLQLAYNKMVAFEEQSGFTYDYLIRTRTDMLFAKSIDFHWLQWTPEEVKERVARIKMLLASRGIEVTTITIFRSFMCTMLLDDVISYFSEFGTDYSPNKEEVIPENIDTFDLHHYIQTGNYILTFRKNLIYIIKRSLFNNVPLLGTSYGSYQSPYSDAYWFNAECQFRAACYQAGLTIFDYDSYYDSRSVDYEYKWNDADFFDESGQVLPRVVYMLLRR
jgi:hypothetical protein